MARRSSLAIKQYGRRNRRAWRSVLDDLVKRGLRKPDFVIVDGATGWKSAGRALGRCADPAVYSAQIRNLLAHAPKRLYEEISADYTDMMYAATPEEVEKRRKSFIRKWQLKHRAVADSLEEAGDQLFTFTRLPPTQWKSARTTNAIERLHEEFKRRIKTQTVLPSCRHSGDVVLGAARFRSNHDAKGRRLGDHLTKNT